MKNEEEKDIEDDEWKLFKNSVLGFYISFDQKCNILGSYKKEG